MRIWLPLLAMLAISSCGPSGSSGPVEVAIIGAPESLFQRGVRLPASAQQIHAATYEGLVALDQAAQVVPAIAERWIVTDDGLSYIFRLRESNWPRGGEITATDVRQQLRDAIARARGTSLGLDLAAVRDIRAMTGRVVEVRLTAPMPDFLRLLAQPELGFIKSGKGAGPMAMSRSKKEVSALLAALPPELRGLPAREDWEEVARPVVVQALPAQSAVAAFSRGDVDLVLGGTIVDFPEAEAGPLSRGTIQVDPAIGLLGLSVRRETGLLADPARREALSMAIDRAALIQSFGIGGWRESSWVVPPETYTEPPYETDRWSGASLGDRREVAAARIRAWAGPGREAVVRVAAIDGLWEDERSSIMERMIVLLHDPVGEVRVAAALGLGRFAYRAELGEKAAADGARVLTALLGVVADPEQPLDVRRRAVEGLGYFANSNEAQAEVGRAYAHPEQLVRESAVAAMGRSMRSTWHPYIERELKSPSPAMRYEAARAVGELGDDGQPMLPSLVPLVEDEDSEIAMAAMWALGQVGGPHAKRVLQRLARSNDAARKQAAQDALEELAISEV